MSKTVLIIGNSGTGKSTSIRTLDPSDTFIINVIAKPLPFKGANKAYIMLSADGLTGNYYASDDSNKIRRVISHVNNKRTDIKTLIIDDWTYSLSNDYMRTALEKGYEKFSKMAQNAWSIMRDLIASRDDLTCFIMAHSDVGSHGIVKMLDEKVCIEGMVSIVLHSMIVNGEYKMLTNSDGIHLAKSPMGMFEDKLIDNDLLSIKNKIDQYLNEESI